jgi:hypothetical protein
MGQSKRVPLKKNTKFQFGNQATEFFKLGHYPKLKEHLGATVAYVTVSKDYPDFIEKLDRFRPRYGDQYQLPFDYYPEHDDGKRLIMKEAAN